MRVSMLNTITVFLPCGHSRRRPCRDRLGRRCSEHQMSQKVMTANGAYVGAIFATLKGEAGDKSRLGRQRGCEHLRALPV